MRVVGTDSSRGSGRDISRASSRDSSTRSGSGNGRDIKHKRQHKTQHSTGQQELKRGKRGQYVRCGAMNNAVRIVRKRSAHRTT